MRERTLFIAKYYFSLIALSILYKPVFLLLNGGSEEYSVADYLGIIYHGLPHDLAVAGYFTAIPMLLTATTAFTNISFKGFFKGYNAFIAIAMALAFVADTTLYPYWEFKLDATVLMYMDSPANAVASISLWQLILLILVFSSVFSGIYLLLGAITPGCFTPIGKSVRERITLMTTAIMASGAIFLGIRGGVTESTNNIGSVFFSDTHTLNHSAINPVFSFIYSSMKVENFSKEYTFMEEEEREHHFHGLYHTDNEITDTLLNTRRPNIITIIFEGLGAALVEELGGKSGITPNISALADEGVLFTNCYANSYRTDRGIPSLLCRVHEPFQRAICHSHVHGIVAPPFQYPRKVQREIHCRRRPVPEVRTVHRLCPAAVLWICREATLVREYPFCNNCRPHEPQHRGTLQDTVGRVGSTGHILLATGRNSFRAGHRHHHDCTADRHYAHTA